MDAWVEVCQGGYQDEQVIQGTRPEEGDRVGEGEEIETEKEIKRRAEEIKRVR